jgi:hypothetical protein
MVPQVVAVPKYMVAYWTTLHTNVLLLYNVNQSLGPSQCKSMPDTFGTEQYSIVQFLIIS